MNHPLESSQGRLVGPASGGAAALAHIYTGPNVTGNGHCWGRGVPGDVFAFAPGDHGDISTASETADRDGREAGGFSSRQRLPVIAGAVNPPDHRHVSAACGLDQRSCRAPLFRIGGQPGCPGHDQAIDGRVLQDIERGRFVPALERLSRARTETLALFPPGEFQRTAGPPHRNRISQNQPHDCFSLRRTQSPLPGSHRPATEPAWRNRRCRSVYPLVIFEP